MRFKIFIDYLFINNKIYQGDNKLTNPRRSVSSLYSRLRTKGRVVLTRNNFRFASILYGIARGISWIPWLLGCGPKRSNVRKSPPPPPLPEKNCGKNIVFRCFSTNAIANNEIMKSAGIAVEIAGNCRKLQAVDPSVGKKNFHLKIFCKKSNFVRLLTMKKIFAIFFILAPIVAPALENEQIFDAYGIR